MLSIVNKMVRRLARRNDGVTAMEYALIAALLAMVIIAALRLLGTNISSTFTGVAGSLGSG